MFKVNNKHQNDARRRYGVFIVTFEYISHLALVINFEQVNADRD